LVDAQRSAQLGSFEVDVAAGEKSWSDELFHIVGIPSGEVPTDSQILESVHPDDQAQMAAFQRSIERAEPGSCTLRIIRPDGEMRSIAIQCFVPNEGETVVSGTVLDVTERMRAEDRLAHRALHDPMTDLPNRILLSERLEQALVNQINTSEPVAVAFVDLDQFKLVNDRLGHAVGDQVLIAVANRLRAAADASDTVGRFGGDEFIVVRPRCPDLESALSFAEELRRSLEAPIAIDAQEFFLTASVGITVSQALDSTTSMQRDADTAMYAAKQRGGDRVSFFDDDLRAASQQRGELAVELRSALAEQQLRLVYQPIYRIDQQRTVGFEALLRWDQPDRGAVPPLDFIPIAEETGLIVPIGHWVLAEALAQLATWRAEGAVDDEIWVSVNVSARQLEERGFVDAVETAVTLSGLPPELVHLEITESVLMNNIGYSIRTVDALHALGLHISVDDFGTGYSSLSYLKQLPVDTLKIDKSFVSGLGRDLEDRSIAQAIIALASALNLQVLAEGVETNTQAHTLAELGCTLGQGFLWSVPVGPAEAVALCTRSRQAGSVSLRIEA
jgi:diguanylate cyclase (GGDEF)-like protein